MKRSIKDDKAFFKTEFVLALILGLASCAPLARAQSTGNFTATGNMTRPRSGHTAALLLDGRVLIAGGGSREAELFDPATNTFAATGSMTTDRPGSAAVLLGSGKVLVTGGNAIDPETRRAVLLSSAELYDPANGQFTSTGNLTQARSSHTATLLQDGRVLLYGGDPTTSNFQFQASAELYDPATGSFIAAGPVFAEFFFPTATRLPDGRVLLASPAPFQGTLAVGKLYDPATAAFTPIGDISLGAYYWHAASLLADGKVLISGGGEVDGPGTFLSNSIVYDPATGKFSATGSMKTGRMLHTSTLLPDGEVLFAGGIVAPPTCPNHVACPFFTPPSDTAELYDPSTGNFRTTGSMTTSRYSHTATLLKNGKVLITGGGGVFSPASAELYDPFLQEPGHVAPWLFAVSPDGRGQGAILHAGTAQLASASQPAVVGEALEIYCSGLDDAADGNPPEVTIGGSPAAVLFFGNAPGFARLNQVNVRVPSGVTSGPAVPVRLTSHGLISNEVTIAVR